MNKYSTALAAVLMGTLSVYAQDVPADYPANYSEVIEGSRAEESLLIYSNMTAEQWTKVSEAFEAKYPWIDVQTLDMNSGEAFQRFEAEVSAGQSSADLLVNVGPSSWIDLVGKGMIEPYESPEAAAYPEAMHPLPGLYTVLGDPLLFVWNKAVLAADAVPTSLEDLATKAAAQPDTYRGRIATYPADKSAFGYAGHYAVIEHHGEKAWDWYTTLAPLTRLETSSGPMIEKVTIGEYVLLYLAGSASTWAAVADPARADLLGWSYIADGTPINGRPAAISATARHPNAAKLMLDFMLSTDGQMAWAGASRMIVRPDIASSDIGGGYTYQSVVDTIGEENTLMVGYDRAQLDGYDAFVERWTSIFK